MWRWSSLRRDALIVGDYRYWLVREWDPATEKLAFIMLNPSTADGKVDDATIRRCIRFAQDNGYGGITILNLFALRATDPRQLRKAEDPVGVDNDRWIAEVAESRRTYGGGIVCAWGAKADPARVRQVLRLVRGIPLYCLGVTKDGHPKHPLYIAASTQLTPWPSQ